MARGFCINRIQQKEALFTLNVNNILKKFSHIQSEKYSKKRIFFAFIARLFSNFKKWKQVMFIFNFLQKLYFIKVLTKTWQHFYLPRASLEHSHHPRYVRESSIWRKKRSRHPVRRRRLVSTSCQRRAQESIASSHKPPARSSLGGRQSLTKTHQAAGTANAPSALFKITLY